MVYERILTQAEPLSCWKYFGDESIGFFSFIRVHEDHIWGMLCSFVYSHLTVECLTVLFIPSFHKKVRNKRRKGLSFAFSPSGVQETVPYNLRPRQDTKSSRSKSWKHLTFPCMPTIKGLHLVTG